jgi:hypothetical protein
LDVAALGQSLNLAVRRGELADLGATLSAAGGPSRPSQYAAAVALGLAGTGKNDLPQNFLQSRLAEPRKRRLSHRLILAVVAVALLGIAAVAGWVYQDHLLRQVAGEQEQFDHKVKPQADAAQTFVDMVSYAQQWHRQDARYASCLRDITNAIPEDKRTYVTSIDIKVDDKDAAAGGSAAANAPGYSKNFEKPPLLSGTIKGRVPTQGDALNIAEQLRRSNFAEVEGPNTIPVIRTDEFIFTISFKYGLPLGKP